MSLVGFVMITFWLVATGVIAFFVVREVRAKRRGPAEFDRYQHEAVRQSGTNQIGRGPNGPSQTWLG